MPRTPCRAAPKRNARNTAHGWRDRCRSRWRRQPGRWRAGSVLLLQAIGEVPVEIVEPLLPQRPEGFDPVGDVLHALGIAPARAALGGASGLDQPSLLEHLEMLRDGRLAERKGLRQLRYVRLAERQSGEHGTARRVAERGEHRIEFLLYSHTAI